MHVDKVAFCYAALKSRLAEQGITQSELALEIGMPRKELRRRLNRGLPFKTMDRKKICHRLSISAKEADRYFFRIWFDENKPD